MPHSLIKEQEKQYNQRRKKTLKAESFFNQMAKKVRAFTCFFVLKEADLQEFWLAPKRVCDCEELTIKKCRTTVEFGHRGSLKRAGSTEMRRRVAYKQSRQATKFLGDVAVVDAWSVAAEVEREDGVVEEGQTERTRFERVENAQKKSINLSSRAEKGG
jgi:hypothetical protein